MKKILILILMVAASQAHAWTRTDTLKVTSDANDARVIGSTLATTGTMYNGKFDDGSYCSSIHRMQSLIPAGQTITSAIFEVRAYGITGTDTSYVMFENANSPSMPSSGSDFNSRTVTDSVQWLGGGTWTEGTRYQKTVTTPFAALYAAGSCDSGEYVNVFWKGRNVSNTVNQYRTILGYDNNPTYVAYLIVEHTTAASAYLGTACLVVEDSATASRGVDTLLANMITSRLGYTVHWHDIDNVKTHEFFDSMKVVVCAGSEVAAPSPVGNLDSAKDVGVVAIGQSFWSVVNLGTATSNSSENARFANLTKSNHWITKVFPDSILMYPSDGISCYGIAIPDSVTSTDIDVLVIDKDYASDTSRCMMAAVDSGGRVFGTSGGPAGSHIAAERRVFCGFFQQQTYKADTCALWTALARSIAWAAKDTLNDKLMKFVCFSGKYELDWVSVVESSSGTDSLESYGNYGSNIGQDSEEKHCFFKVKNSAMQRKVGSIYRAIDVDYANLIFTYKGSSQGWNDTGVLIPTTWSTSFVFQPIIRKWQIDFRNCIHGATCPNACWSFAWRDTAAEPDVEYHWGLGGAREYDVDTRDVQTDTITVTNSTPIRTRFIVGLEPDTLGGRMLDTLLNHGWASRVVAYSAERDDPVGDPGDYGEHTFYQAGETNNITSINYAWPSVWVDFSSWSTTVPTPTIAIETPEYDDDSVVFTGTYGQIIPLQYVTLSNSEGGALECATITDNSGGWLFMQASGTNMPITLTLGLQGQSVGYTSATVTITCADASNSPRTFKVVRYLTAASGRPVGFKDRYR